MPHSGPVLLKSETCVLWHGFRRLLFECLRSAHARLWYGFPIPSPSCYSKPLTCRIYFWIVTSEFRVVKWRIYELEAFSFCVWGKWEFLGKGQLVLPIDGTKTSYQTLAHVCNMGYRVFCSINVLLKHKTWKECFSNTWDILGWWRKGIFDSTLFHKTSSLGNKGERIEKKESVTLSYTASY